VVLDRPFGVLGGVDVLFVAVDTPQGDDGSADLTSVAAVVRSVRKALAEFSAERARPLVVWSTRAPCWSRYLSLLGGPLYALFVCPPAPTSPLQFVRTTWDRLTALTAPCQLAVLELLGRGRRGGDLRVAALRVEEHRPPQEQAPSQ
jgi:UDP-glucose/GDP-mannose dehydrogenase family, NAD binding domain